MWLAQSGRCGDHGVMIPGVRTIPAVAAARWLFDGWGIEGGLSRLPGYEDDNYQVATDAGRYVLRISHPLARRAELIRQNRAMRRADSALPGAVPRPVESRAGRDIETCELHPGRLARVFTFVEGRLWADARPVPLATHRSLGVFLARLDTALAGLVAGEPHAPMEWDLQRAGDVVAGNLRELRAGGRRSLVERWVGRHRDEIEPALSGLPVQLIHNDANDRNLLVTPGLEGPEVSGIIDFADAIECVRVAELAIAIAYAVQHEADVLACAGSVRSGYCEHCPLTADELDALPVLVAMRLSTTVVLAARNLREFPDNEYFQFNTESSWRALEQWSGAHLEGSP